MFEQTLLGLLKQVLNILLSKMASANLVLSNTKYLTLTIAIVIVPHIFNVGFADANNTTSKGARVMDGMSKGT